MKTKLALQIFLFLFMLCGANKQAGAVILHDLYTVSIDVPDVTIETRNKHLPLAFNNLMIKITGSSDILQDPQYIKASEHLERFINAYAYSKKDTEYILKLNFNEQLLDNLLIKTGRVSLGKKRQPLILWLVLEGENKAELITANDNLSLLNKIQLLAKERELPIILPLFDLTERIKINVQDVINFNTEVLQQASKRYDAKIILIGKINNTNDVWNCVWQLQNNQQNSQWQINSDNLEDVLNQSFNWVGNQMVAQNKQQQAARTPPNLVVLRVNGINNPTSYAKVLSYLKDLQGIKRVEIGQVDDKQATFTLVADGGRDFVKQSLLLDNVLITDNRSLESSMDLIYRTNL